MSLYFTPSFIPLRFFPFLAAGGEDASIREGGRWNRDSGYQSTVMCIVDMHVTHSRYIPEYHHLPSLLHTGKAPHTVPMCIECTYCSKGKTIFSEMFRHEQLLKDFIFTWIQCTCFPSHKQYSMDDFSTKSCRNIPFSCILSVPITLKEKKYSPKYFGTNSCRNILFSCVLIAHITPKAKQYSPKYFGTNCCQKILFSHVFSAHVP